VSDINPKALEEINHIEMLVGRNILLFQEVELLLKEINHLRHGAGTENNLLKRKRKINELSLGRLSDTSVLNKIDSKLSVKNATEFYHTYDLLKDYEPLNAAIKFFNDINADRNFLVHNFIAKWNLAEAEVRIKAIEWLINQHHVSFSQKEVLVLSLNIINSRIDIINEYFSSEEGMKQWNDFLDSNEEAHISFTFQEK
jgi:hypothetical protein